MDEMTLRRIVALEKRIDNLERTLLGMVGVVNQECGMTSAAALAWTYAAMLLNDCRGELGSDVIMQGDEFKLQGKDGWKRVNL